MSAPVITGTRAVAAAPERPARRGRRIRPATVLLHTILVTAALIMLSPLVFGLFAAVSPLDQILSRNGGILPRVWEWGNYVRAWTTASFSRYFVNSVVVTALVVILDTLASSMTGYVLARRRLRGQRLLEGLYVGTLFVGLTTATLYPQYVIAQALGLDNLLGIALVQLAGIMLVHVFLIKAFVLGLGTEMEDAARVDGCGRFGTYWRIAFPLMRPILATTVILGFQASWNNYQVPLVFSLAAPDLRTLVVGVSALQYDAADGMTPYNTVLAGANMALVPIVVIFIVLQRHFVRGWTDGSVKG
ncbi:multiple sugar transport system permease protein [Nonomuraea thailandensis]|uniref:Multiple sugar transport system permease protein n=1 Tax=Nonomuraea thailandensis TaxID=1188745 RepID=A0A9X2K2J6_9ACTN|nr:carbohydrate ABC transporter permease [Nonomuraea thailandensis]MCP2358447.1 multiple sugar transport system permease protein [Nonomuraea thailandensis]